MMNIFQILKKKIFSNGFVNNIFYFLRYFPLLVLANDWILFDNYGFYLIFSRFEVHWYLDYMKTSPNMINFIIFINVLLQLAFFLYLSYYQRKYMNFSKLKLCQQIKFNAFFYCLLYYFIFTNFYFSNIPFSLVFKSIFLNKCNDNNPLFIDYNLNSLRNIADNCLDFSHLGVFLSSMYLISSFIFNYIMDIYLFSPHNIQILELSNFAWKKVNYDLLLFPCLNLFIMLEKTFFLNYYILINKLCTRLFMIIFLFYNFKYIERLQINKFTLFLELFCFCGLILEFVSFPEILSLLKNTNNQNILNLKSFQANPPLYTHFYSSKFLIIKLLFQLIIASYSVEYFSSREIQQISDFYKIKKLISCSIKNNICYLNKFFYFVHNHEALFKPDQYGFFSLFYRSLLDHKLMCHDISCNCSLLIQRYQEILLIFDQQQRMKEAKAFLISLIHNLLETLILRTQKNKDWDSVELIYCSVLFKIFFQKRFVSAYFDLEKLSKFKIIIENKIIIIKLEILRYLTVQEFLLESQNKNNKNVESLYSNFLEFYSYSYLLKDKVKIFELYSKINQNISNNERNRRNRNREYFNQNNKNRFYDFENLINNFKELINKIKFNQIFSFTVPVRYYENDKFFLNSHFIFYKFFNGDSLPISSKNQFELRENTDLLDSKYYLSNSNSLNKILCVRENNDYANFNYLSEENYSAKTTKQKLILRKNTEGNLIFEKISSQFASDMNYTQREIIGKNIEFLLPPSFIEMYHLYIQDLLYNKESYQKDANFYFISKNDYCKNYMIEGIVIITLDKEILLYTELEKIEKLKDICFISFDYNGEIIAYDENIEDNLFIDNYFMKYVNPNFFKNFFELADNHRNNDNLKTDEKKLILKQKRNFKKKSLLNKERRDFNKNLPIKNVYKSIVSKNRNKIQINNSIDDNNKNKIKKFRTMKVMMNKKESENKLKNKNEENNQSKVKQNITSKDSNADEITDLIHLIKNANNKNHQNFSNFVDYFEIINKLRKCDFSKLYELKYNNDEFIQKDYDIKNFNYAEKFEILVNIFEGNIDDISYKKISAKDRRVEYYYNQRNFLGLYFFYDIYLDFSSVRYLNLIKCLIKQGFHTRSPINKFDIEFNNDIFKSLLKDRSEAASNKYLSSKYSEKTRHVSSNFSDDKKKTSLRLKENKKETSLKNDLDVNIKYNLSQCIMINNESSDKKIEQADNNSEMQRKKIIDNKKENKFTSNILNLIKNLTLYFKDDKEILEINLSIVQIFVDHYYSNNKKIKNQIIQSFENFHENNNFEQYIKCNDTNLNFENISKINIKKRIILFLILSFLFFLLFYSIDYMNVKFYDNSFLFSEFSHLTIMLKTYYALMSSSILSIYLVQTNIEKSQDTIKYKLDDNTYVDVIYNNDIEMHLKNIKLFSNLYLEKFYYLRKLYYSNMGNLELKNNFLNMTMTVKHLSQNWQEYTENTSFIESLGLFHLYANSLQQKEIPHIQLDIIASSASKKIFLDSNLPPTKSEIYFYFFIKNSVNPILTSFIELFIDSENKIFVSINNGKNNVFYVYLFTSSICIISVVSKMIFLVKNYKVVLIKLNLVTHYLKIFHQVLIEKISLIIEVLENKTYVNNINNTPSTISISSDTEDNKSKDNEKTKTQSNDDVHYQRIKFGENIQMSTNKCIYKNVNNNNTNIQSRTRTNKSNFENYHQNNYNHNKNRKYKIHKDHSTHSFNHVKVYYIEENEAILREKEYSDKTKNLDLRKLNLKEKNIIRDGFNSSKIRNTDISHKKCYIDYKTQTKNFSSSLIEQNKNIFSYMLKENSLDPLKNPETLHTLALKDNIDIASHRDNYEGVSQNMIHNSSLFLEMNFPQDQNTINLENYTNMPSSSHPNNFTFQFSNTENNLNLNESSAKNLDLCKPLKTQQLKNLESLEIMIGKLKSNYKIKNKETHLAKTNSHYRGSRYLNFFNSEDANENDLNIFDKYLSNLCFMGINFMKKKKIFRKSLITHGPKPMYGINENKFEIMSRKHTVNNPLKIANKKEHLKSENYCRLENHKNESQKISSISECYHSNVKLNAMSHNAIMLNDQRDNNFVEKGSNILFRKNSSIKDDFQHLNNLNNKTEVLSDNIVFTQQNTHSNHGEITHNENNQNYNCTNINMNTSQHLITKNLKSEKVDSSLNHNIQKEDSASNNYALRLLKTLQNDNSKDDDEIIRKQFFAIEYSKPGNYYFFRNVLIFLIFILVIICLLINFSVYHSYSNLEVFNSLKYAYMERNTIFFDSLFFLKMTLVNKNFPEYDLYRNNSLYNIFDEALKAFDLKSEIIEKYENMNIMRQLSLNRFSYVESKLESEYFCEYFAYLNNKTLLASWEEKTEEELYMPIENLQALKNQSTEYKEAYTDCLVKSGNLFSRGIHEYFNIVKYTLTNQMTELKNYKKLLENVNQQTDDQTIKYLTILQNPDYYKKSISFYLARENLIKVEHSIRGILFPLSEIYMNIFDQSEIIFKRNLYNAQVICNYSILTFIQIIFIFYIITLIFLIYIPDKVLANAEIIIKNSLDFKV